MDDFVTRLKMHMKERDVKQIDICRETGIPTSLMSNYLTDKKSPGLDNAIAIAEYFGMGLDEFLGIAAKETGKQMTTRTDSERKVLTAFRGLTPSDQQVVIRLAQGLKPNGGKSRRSQRVERSA